MGIKLTILVITSLVILSVPVLAEPLNAEDDGTAYVSLSGEQQSDAYLALGSDNPELFWYDSQYSQPFHEDLAVGFEDSQSDDSGIASADALAADRVVIRYDDLSSYAEEGMYARLGNVMVTFTGGAWKEIAGVMEGLGASTMSIAAVKVGNAELGGKVVDKYLISTYADNELVNLSDLGISEYVRITSGSRSALLAVFSEAGTVIAEGSIPLDHSGYYNLGYAGDSSTFGSIMAAVLIGFVVLVPLLAYYNYRKNSSEPVAKVEVDIPVTKVIYCPACGSNINPAYGFCVQCGLTLKNVAV